MCRWGVVVPALSSFAGLFPVRSLRVTQTIAFCQVMLLVNTSASMSELGAVNGLGQTLAAAMRALDPSAAACRGPGRRLPALRQAPRAETCPGVSRAYLPYGARAFLVVAAIAAACALPTAPPSVVVSTTRSAQGSRDESVVFAPSLEGTRWRWFVVDFHGCMMLCQLTSQTASTGEGAVPDGSSES